MNMMRRVDMINASLREHGSRWYLYARPAEEYHLRLLLRRFSYVISESRFDHHTIISVLDGSCGYRSLPFSPNMH